MAGADAEASPKHQTAKDKKAYQGRNAQRHKGCIVNLAG